MANDRAIYWITALGLIGMGLIVGLAPAVFVAASVGVYLACDQIIFGGKVTAL